jgi:hypothetical protein
MSARLALLTGTVAILLTACVEVRRAPDDARGEGGTSEGGTSDDGGAGGASQCDGDCVVTCDPGFTDCNGLAEDGCEAQLTIDADNCGTCGNSCGDWGDCFHSTCAEIVATAAAAAVGANALVIESDSLYWSSGGVDAAGVIARVPLAGGAPVTLADQQHYADCLRSNGTSLAWSLWGTPGVYSMPIGGGAVQALWLPPLAERPRVLAMNATTLYFSTGGDVHALPLAGGAPSVLASGFVDVSAGVLDGSSLVVTDLGPELVGAQDVPGHPEGSVARVSLPSGAVTTLAQHLDTPVALTVSADGALFWAEAGSLATYYGDDDAKVNLGTLGRVVRAEPDGSSPQVIADQLAQPVDLAVDTQHVYVAVAGTVGGVDPSNFAYQSDGNLLRAPLAGGKIEVLMPAVDARRVVLTEDAVFYSSWVYGLILKQNR